MLWILQSCVLLNTVETQSCDTPSDCSDVFGIGYTCQEEGFCATVTSIPRCTNTQPTNFWDDPTVYADAFVIGQLFDFDSDDAKLAASQMAYQDIVGTGSQGNWIDDRPLVQISCNYANDVGDGLQEKDAVEAVTSFLIEEVGAEVIIGPAGSQDAKHATNLSGERALFISPSATAQSLKPLDIPRTDGQPGLFWRTTGPDTLQSTVLQWHLHGEGLDNFAIISQNGPYGLGIADTLIEQHETNTGIRPTYETIEVNDTAAISGVVNSVLSDSSIQALIFISSDKNDIMEAIKAMRVHDSIPLYLTDAAAKEELLTDIQTYAGGDTDLESDIVAQIKGTKPSIPSTALFDVFASRLETLFQKDARSSVFAAHTYDATWLAATALMWAHTNEEPHSIEGLARGLRQISDPNGPEVNLNPDDWNQLRTSLEAGNTINLSGTSGNLDYDPTTEELTTSVDLWVFSPDLDGFDVLISCSDETCNE
jgi:ABC-type branched-subunit amino acid transport system substrate-binding protein